MYLLIYDRLRLDDINSDFVFPNKRLEGNNNYFSSIYSHCTLAIMHTQLHGYMSNHDTVINTYMTLCATPK